MLYTSGFVDGIMFSHNAPGMVSIDTAAVLQQVVINFQHIRQGATSCLTLSSYTVAADWCTGAKSDIYDCLVHLL